MKSRYVRYTIKDARRIASVHGGHCLSDRLKHNNFKLNWQCQLGHRFSRSITEILDKDRWCPVCLRHERRLLIAKIRKQREQEQREEQRRQVRRIIRLLQKEFPYVFPKEKYRIVPFKLGIHKDILHFFDVHYPDISKAHVRAAIDEWTHRQGYEKASTCMGMPRYDLYGCITGEVTNQEAERNWQAICKRRQEKKKRPADEYKIYTDGSCSGKEFTWSFVVFKNDRELFFDYGIGYASNAESTLAEVTAALMAVKWIMKNKIRQAILMYDNNTIGDLDVKNHYDTPAYLKNYRQLMRLVIKKKSLILKHVTGHSRDWGNERADGLCTLAYSKHYSTGLIRNSHRLKMIREKRIANRPGTIKWYYSVFVRRKLWQRCIKGPTMESIRNTALKVGNWLVDWAKNKK